MFLIFIIIQLYLLKDFKGISSDRFKNVDAFDGTPGRQPTIKYAGTNVNILSIPLRKTFGVTKDIDLEDKNLFLLQIINNKIDYRFINKIIEYNKTTKEYYLDELKLIEKMYKIYNKLEKNNNKDDLNLIKIFKLKIFNKQLKYTIDWALSFLKSKIELNRFLDKFKYNPKLKFKYNNF